MSFSLSGGKLPNYMKTVGEKCGWIIPKKERRVLMLLREHTRERDQEFVSKSPSIPRRKRVVNIKVDFAQAELSAFQPRVEVLKRPKP